MLSLLILLSALSGEARAADPGVRGEREAQAADARHAASTDPELAAWIDQVQPTLTRTGVPRLVDERLETPLATPLLLERALRESDTLTRRALTALSAI